MKHPYIAYEKSLAWKIIYNKVTELEKNGDIILSTPKEYVVGYLVKNILESKEIDTNHLSKLQ